MEKSMLAIVRGGGDLATGVIYRLWRAHFRVLCLEAPKPRAIRRAVSAAQAVFDGEHMVESMKVVRIDSYSDWKDASCAAVLVDPDGRSIAELKPRLLVDATMTKRRTNTAKEMAPLVIAIGPGFSAPVDAHAVIETKRGHRLGRVITDGSAAPDTGVPGIVMGCAAERLLRAPSGGRVEPFLEIGDHVTAGELIAEVGGAEVRARIPGVLRGLIHPSVDVTKGLKIGDIDPRGVREHCFSISDKALAVGGGVLEALTNAGRLTL